MLKVRFDEGDEGWLQQSFFDKYICDCESKALEKHYEHVFPHCRQVCIERGIEFYVNITPCPYELPYLLNFICYVLVLLGRLD